MWAVMQKLRILSGGNWLMSRFKTGAWKAVGFFLAYTGVNEWKYLDYNTRFSAERRRESERKEGTSRGR